LPSLFSFCKHEAGRHHVDDASRQAGRQAVTTNCMHGSFLNNHLLLYTHGGKVYVLGAGYYFRHSRQAAPARFCWRLRSV
jgi:hypothetical protein